MCVCVCVCVCVCLNVLGGAFLSLQQRRDSSLPHPSSSAWLEMTCRRTTRHIVARDTQTHTRTLGMEWNWVGNGILIKWFACTPPPTPPLYFPPNGMLIELMQMGTHSLKDLKLLFFLFFFFFAVAQNAAYKELR